MKNKIKIIALWGPSGSGKDTVKSWILKHIKNTHKIISCTTRPKREYEKEGEPYHFLTDEEFGEGVINGNIIEATSFNDWFYGTSLDALDENKINVGAFNPQALECIMKDDRFDILPIEIFTPDKIRLLRSLKREKYPDCHEICRRFLSDEKDFTDIDPEIKKVSKIYLNNKKWINIRSIIRSSGFIK